MYVFRRIAKVLIGMEKVELAILLTRKQKDRKMIGKEKKWVKENLWNQFRKRDEKLLAKERIEKQIVIWKVKDQGRSLWEKKILKMFLVFL